MPTHTTTRKKLYACNDSQVTFPFTFPIGSASDIVVKVRTDATGATVTLESPAEYSVTNASGNWDNGGSVVTVATYAAGKTLLIKRVTTQTQTKDYIEGDDFPAESHEEGLDKLTRIVQELQEGLDRCIKMPDSDDDDLSGDMPTSVERANRWLGFDANGEPSIVNLIRIYAILDFMRTFIEAADATAALTALGLTISAFVKTLLDDADATTALSTLGIPADTLHLVDGAGEPAFENAWDNVGGVYEAAKFYKDIENLLSLKGRVTGGASDTVIYTLPIGKRPDKKMTFPVLSEKRCYIEIDTNGEIKVVNNPLDHTDLLNIGTNTHAQIDTFIAARTSYDTGWVSNNDWTDQQLGTAVGGSVVHNLGANLSALLVKVLISTDGTDNNGFEILYTTIRYAWADDIARDYNYGITIYQVDTNNLLIQTGKDGLAYLDDVGAWSGIDNEAWYYKIAVYKLA